MILTDKEIGALAAGKFETHCLDITLTQHGTSAPRVYAGPGSIYQAGDRLRFRLYARGLRFGDTLLAATIPDEDGFLGVSHYYTFETIDFQGRPWRCDSVCLVDMNWSGPAGGGVIDEELDFLTCTRPPFRPHPGARFTAYVFDGLRLPANTSTVHTTERSGKQEYRSSHYDALELRSCDTDFLIYREESWTVIRGTSPADQLEPHFTERVREAFRFLTSRLVIWDVLEERDSTMEKATIAGPRTRGPAPRIDPPIQLNLAHGDEHVCRLFDAYLAHVVRVAGDDYHPISAEWGEVLRSSTGTLETQAAISCTCVEALSRCLPLERRPNEPDVEGQQQSVEWGPRAISCLEAAGAPKRVVERVAGLFRDMNRSSADVQTILQRLAAAGAVDAEAFRIWKHLRPASAHAERQRFGEPRKLARRCDQVTALLYQLVFHAIGYAGGYSDPGTRKWREYPFPAPR